MYLKYLLLLMFSCLGTYAFGQETFFYDTYHPNDNTKNELFDAEPIAVDAVFELRIEGTYSVWGTSTWSAPCGDIEKAPMYPSTAGNMTGNVGFDAEYMYSLPDLERCTSNEIPTSIARIEITLDNGATWFHPTTDDHIMKNIYTYIRIWWGRDILLGSDRHQL